MQIIELGMSKAVSDSFFNPQASSLFRTNGSDLLNAEQLAGHLGVKVGWVKRQSRIKHTSRHCSMHARSRRGGQIMKRTH
jgi:hypothetical protein